MNLPESGIQMDGDDISVRISIPRSSPLKYFKPDNVTHQAVLIIIVECVFPSSTSSVCVWCVYDHGQFQLRLIALFVKDVYVL